ncbi:MAG: VOC family protein [Methanomassiliicoccales archaeon]|nr:VOC family protein [Methanomassiliicoccales archaeon]
MIESVDHIAVNVTDLDRSVEFYTKALGMKEVLRWKVKIPGIKEIAFVKTEGGMLELLAVDKPKKARPDDPSAAGVKHLCFAVKNIEKEVERMKKMKVPVIQDFHILNEDHLETVSGTMRLDLKKGLKRAVFADPDGIPIELLQAVEVKK